MQQKIKLQKVEISEINVLKNRLNTFYFFNENNLHLHTKDVNMLFQKMLLIDIARDLYFSFGSKLVSNLKNQGKTCASFTINVKEAIVLIECCSFTTTIDNDFEKYVLQKYTRILHENLINCV